MLLYFFYLFTLLPSVCFVSIFQLLSWASVHKQCPTFRCHVIPYQDVRFTFRCKDCFGYIVDSQNEGIALAQDRKAEEICCCTHDLSPTPKGSSQLSAYQLNPNSAALTVRTLTCTYGTMVRTLTCTYGTHSYLHFAPIVLVKYWFWLVNGYLQKN